MADKYAAKRWKAAKEAFDCLDKPAQRSLILSVCSKWADKFDATTPQQADLLADLRQSITVAGELLVDDLRDLDAQVVANRRSRFGRFQDRSAAANRERGAWAREVLRKLEHHPEFRELWGSGLKRTA